MSAIDNSRAALASYEAAVEDPEQDVAIVSQQDAPHLAATLRGLVTDYEEWHERASRTYETFDLHRNQAEARARDADARLVRIGELLSSLDLDSSITREGTAWGSTLREALSLTLEPKPTDHTDGSR